MSFRTKRVLLSVPFYMLFEYFLIKYIFLLIGGIENSYLIVLTVLIGLNRFIPMFFEAKKSRGITRFLTAVDGIWMWFSLMFFIDILVIYAVGHFIHLPLAVILCLLAIVPVLGVYNYWKAHNLVVREKTLRLDNLSKEINIAHLSDIHFGSVRHKEIIEDIKDKLNSIDCDIAIISGDLADGSCVVEPDDFMAFKDVKVPLIFTPGNHDYYMGIQSVITACENAGVVVLDRKSFEFECLNIYGISYSFDDKGVPDVDEDIIKSDKVNIINYHVPYYFDEFSSLGFDIQLSGHTHGGQFYPVVWVGNLIFKYNMGVFENKLGKYIHVTTGVGSMDTPMRWGTESEIVILKLKKA